jgi:DNA-binding MarR family transcriptional regulator
MTSVKKYIRLSKKEKRTLIQLHNSGEWKSLELAHLFKITPGRVSQLITNYYDEQKGLELNGKQQ